PDDLRTGVGAGGARARLVSDDLSGPGLRPRPAGDRAGAPGPRQPDPAHRGRAGIEPGPVPGCGEPGTSPGEARPLRTLAHPGSRLGSGPLIAIGLTAGAALWLLHLPLALALLLAAILAPADPVVLRDVTQDARLPTVVRRALSIESGANDAVVLPVVLVMIA